MVFLLGGIGGYQLRSLFLIQLRFISIRLSSEIFSAQILQCLMDAIFGPELEPNVFCYYYRCV